MKWWAVFNDLATCFSQDGTINSSETWQQWPVAVLSVKDPTADTAHAQAQGPLAKCAGLLTL